MTSARRRVLIALLLWLSAVSVVAAGCGARLTPEQRNAVVGRPGTGIDSTGVSGEGR